MGERVASDADLDGAGLRIGICCGRFNRHITDRLLEGPERAWPTTAWPRPTRSWCGPPGPTSCPSSPSTCSTAGGRTRSSPSAPSSGARPGTTTSWRGNAPPGCNGSSSTPGRPVVFGVLTTENDQQALERSSDEDNKGHEAVETAIEMVNLLKSLSGGP